MSSNFVLINGNVLVDANDLNNLDYIEQDLVSVVGVDDLSDYPDAVNLSNFNDSDYSDKAFLAVKGLIPVVNQGVVSLGWRADENLNKIEANSHLHGSNEALVAHQMSIGYCFQGVGYKGRK